MAPCIGALLLIFIYCMKVSRFFRSSARSIRHGLFKTKKRTAVSVAICVLVLGITTYFGIFYQLPSPEGLKNFKVTPLATHLYDRNGKLLYAIYSDQNRTPVVLKDLPPYVGQASIAIEDKDFYHHAGISFISGILRAIRDMIEYHTLQGGSTLTQQLVKGALLTPERSVRRKLREIVLAVWVEQIFTKDQILEMYLNQVPYGGAVYGVEQAARTYFGKSAKDLTIAEAATLAGLPQAPSIYSPFVDPQAATTRRNEVLQKMYEQKYITKEQYDTALATPLVVQPPTTSIRAPHFVFYVKSQLEQEYGSREVQEGGLKVTTTVDLDIQEQAEKIIKEELDKIKALHVTNGAALVTRPSTGEILAMVGSADYFATGSGAFNVTTALRQPGSSIKPFNYVVGIDRRLVTAGTVFLDDKTCFPKGQDGKPYCPVNYDGQFHGPVQLRFALGNSFNIPAVKMLAINGVENFVASASAFGFTTLNDASRYGLSLTLGGGEIRMTDFAHAYSIFPNQGKSRPLQSILKVQTNSGKVLYQFKDANFVQDISKPLGYPNFFAIPGKQLVSKEAIFIISHILLDNNARLTEFGPNSSLVIPNKAVSVKTGTTDDKKDNWTVGYTPDFLTMVWVGNNDNTPMNQYLASGITGAAPIWNRIMTYVLRNQQDLWPIRPDSVVGTQICWTTGALMVKAPDGTPSCPARFEYFIKGTTPQPDTGLTHMMVPVDTTTDKLGKEGDPNVQMKDKIVIKDQFGMYCVDCNHDGENTPNFSVAPTPVP